MTDKVQKIRKEVERIQLYTQSEVLKQVLDYIDEVQEEAELSHSEVTKISDQEEPVSEDLKEIAWNHADKKCHLDIAVFTPDEVKKEREKMQFTWQDLYDAVMFGAQSQKEQMMKDAKESEVVITNKGILLSDLRIEDFDYEDKLKVIVIKED